MARKKSPIPILESMPTNHESQKQNSFYQLNKDTGRIELIDCFTGRVLAVQKTQEDLMAEGSKRRLIRSMTPSGEIVYLEKGITLDSLETRKHWRYSAVMADLIFQKMREGHGITRICEMDGFPSYGTICAWRRAHEEFAKGLEQARKDRAERMYDKILSSVENLVDEDKVAIEKLKVDVWKWAASVDNAEQYGNRTKITGDASAPVQIVISTGIVREEKKELADEDKVVETTGNTEF